MSNWFVPVHMAVKYCTRVQYSICLFVMIQQNLYLEFRFPVPLSAATLYAVLLSCFCVLKLQGLLGKVIPSWHALMVVSVSDITRFPPKGTARHVCIELILHRKWATKKSKGIRNTDKLNYMATKVRRPQSTWLLGERDIQFISFDLMQGGQTHINNWSKCSTWNKTLASIDIDWKKSSSR